MSARKASTDERLAELERRADAQDARIGYLIETLAAMCRAAGVDPVQEKNVSRSYGSQRDRLRLVRGDAS